MRRTAAALLVLLACAVVSDAQTRRRSTPRPPAVKREPAQMTCAAELGDGVETSREFCDVLTGRDPAEGVLITIPAHTGPATITFDLHNRHTYSEQEVRAGQAFAEYTATIGLLTLDNNLIARAAVHSSFRTAADLYDRVAGGAGPGGVKAVAPLGVEPVRIEIPAEVTRLAVLGERLVVERLGGRETFTSPGRPVAILSNVRVEYRPAPARAPARRPGTSRPR